MSLALLSLLLLLLLHKFPKGVGGGPVVFVICKRRSASFRSASRCEGLGLPQKVGVDRLKQNQYKLSSCASLAGKSCGSSCFVRAQSPCPPLSNATQSFKSLLLSCTSRLQIDLHHQQQIQYLLPIELEPGHLHQRHLHLSVSPTTRERVAPPNTMTASPPRHFAYYVSGHGYGVCYSCYCTPSSPPAKLLGLSISPARNSRLSTLLLAPFSRPQRLHRDQRTYSALLRRPPSRRTILSRSGRTNSCTFTSFRDLSTTQR